MYTLSMNQLGVIGLGTMGAALARNAARNGAEVSVYNRTQGITDEFMKEYGQEGEIKAFKSYKDLVQSLAHPRAILIMVKAGYPVDKVINDVREFLEPGDIIIDGGNSLYSDSERRFEELEKKGLRFIGLGVSGGEEGALNGPSMMAGGDSDSYKELEDLLASMAADDGEGGKCVSFLGEGGAGHFVKMVHNGIEYGVMQIIAECYDVLKRIGGFTNEQLSETFAAWRDSDELNSYLLEITADIFTKKDPEGSEDLIDVIKDSAGQKGTGKWTTQAAHDFGVAIPTINAAVDARIISGSEEERESGKDFPVFLDEQDPIPPPKKLNSILRNAYELSVILTYLQGLSLIKKANEEKEWGIDASEVARIWQGGCIIRSVLLKSLQNSLSSDNEVASAAKEELINRFSGDPQKDWRRIVTYASSRGIPIPAISASLSYWDSLRSDRLPQNLIQAQRDFFGAHGFERVDKEGEGFHGGW